MLLFLFLSYWLICLIPAIIAQISNPIVQLVISVGISAKVAKTEIEIHPVTGKTKVRKHSM